MEPECGKNTFLLGPVITDKKPVNVTIIGHLGESLLSYHVPKYFLTTPDYITSPEEVLDVPDNVSS